VLLGLDLDPRLVSIVDSIAIDHENPHLSSRGRHELIFGIRSQSMQIVRHKS
jgi:hypothetical protein